MNNNKKIPVFDISLGEKEKEYIKDCVDTSFIGQGPYVKKLEEKFSAFVDCKYGTTTTSGYVSSFQRQSKMDQHSK